jgi:membrane protein implicated in regulation of membrane protease activity
MGIRFSDSILSLLAATFGVLTAYFVGHGLSEMTAWPWLTAAAMLALALGLGAFTIRRIRDHAERRQRTHEH